MRIGDFLEHSVGIVQNVMLLIIVSDMDIGAEANRSGIGSNLTDDDFQKRRLSGTVAANDCNVFAAKKIKGDVIKKPVLIKGLGKVTHLHNIPAGTNARL